jgi:clan AA aspartic protease (TIGR02281 family)
VISRRTICLVVLALITVCSVAATVSSLNEAGKAAYERGDFSAAERLFSQALAQSPDDPLLHYHRGVALMRLSRWREASADFEATLRLNPPRDVEISAREGIRSLAPTLREPTSRSTRQDSTSVPVRRIRGNWVAEVRVNDLRTAQFLVDTGATACVISPELAKALGIEPDSRAPAVQLRTISGLTSARVVSIPSLSVGESEAQNVVAVVHPLDPPMDGILGNTFLSRFTVTLDPEQGLLHLSSK